MKISDVDISSLIIDGIDHSDHPDYCDAYYSYGEFYGGEVLTDDQLDRLKELDPEMFNELLIATIY